MDLGDHYKLISDAKKACQDLRESAESCKIPSLRDDSLNDWQDTHCLFVCYLPIMP
jgi:hypothetical protein